MGSFITLLFVVAALGLQFASYRRQNFGLINLALACTWFALLVSLLMRTAR